MRAHELVAEWKEHIAEGGTLTLKQYRSQYGKIGLAADSGPVEVYDGEPDDNLEEEIWGTREPEEQFDEEDHPVVVAKPQSKKGPSKKEQARVIYNDIAGKGHGRKMTIQRFIDVLGLSKAGASTYYSNFKLNKW